MVWVTSIAPSSVDGSGSRMCTNLKKAGNDAIDDLYPQGQCYEDREFNGAAGHAAPIQAKTPVTLTITPDSKIFLNKTPVTLDTLAPTLKGMLASTDASVIVAADSSAPNGITVQAMLKAREAGAQHFLIAVKHVD